MSNYDTFLGWLSTLPPHEDHPSTNTILLEELNNQDLLNRSIPTVESDTLDLKIEPRSLKLRLKTNNKYLLFAVSFVAISVVPIIFFITQKDDHVPDDNPKPYRLNFNTNNFKINSNTNISICEWDTFDSLCFNCTCTQETPLDIQCKHKHTCKKNYAPLFFINNLKYSSNINLLTDEQCNTFSETGRATTDCFNPLVEKLIMLKHQTPIFTKDGCCILDLFKSSYNICNSVEHYNSHKKDRFLDCDCPTNSTIKRCVFY